MDAMVNGCSARRSPEPPQHGRQNEDPSLRRRASVAQSPRAFSRMFSLEDKPVASPSVPFPPLSWTSPTSQKHSPQIQVARPAEVQLRSPGGAGGARSTAPSVGPSVCEEAGQFPVSVMQGSAGCRPACVDPTSQRAPGGHRSPPPHHHQSQVMQPVVMHPSLGCRSIGPAGYRTARAPLPVNPSGYVTRSVSTTTTTSMSGPTTLAALRAGALLSELHMSTTTPSVSTCLQEGCSLSLTSASGLDTNPRPTLRSSEVRYGSRSPGPAATPRSPLGRLSKGGPAEAWRTPAEERFPTTGRPVTLKLICTHLEDSEPPLVSRFRGRRITSDWELWHLLQVSELTTGVHRDSQKLYHAGREILPGCTIREAVGVDELRLPTRFAVHVVFDEDRFPQLLDPMGLVRVPLGADDFTLPKSPKGGFHWTMRSDAVERHGVRGSGDSRVTAQCSPTHPVTFSEDERLAAKVPSGAVEFAWSYPVANWEQVECDPHLLEDWGAKAEDSLAVKNFLAVGGFIYLDAKAQIMGVTTPWPMGRGKGGMHFGRPLKWQPCWTDALLEDGRLHRVTIGPLQAAGACSFCWLRPGEVFAADDGEPAPCQPDVPHGAFAFLFHEMADSGPEGAAVDCYFPVSRVTPHAPDRSDAFSLVGEECRSPLLGHTSAQLHSHDICAQDG